MIADFEARLQAIDPTRSFIVQAPAGSGKTGLLTQRFLQLLARVSKPEEIVAITFTRKAAAEMRQRLLEALQEGHETHPPADDYKRQTWELAARVLRRDLLQGWKLEQNPSRLRIQTIDSLCSSLVRQLPVGSGLGSQVDPVEDPEELFQAAARKTMSWLDSDHSVGASAIGDALARVIQHLDNDLVKVEKLIVTMLASREQWLPYTAHEDGFREHLEACLERLVCEEIALANDLIPYGVWDEWLALTRYATHNLEGHFPHNRRPRPVPEDLPVWSAMAGVLLTRDGNWRKEKGFTKVCGFPAGVGQSEKAECKAWKERACLLVQSFEDDAQLAERLHNLRSLPSPRYTDDQWSFLAALFQVLRVAVAQLYVVFGERESVDFTEISQRALQALGSPDAPTDLALSLDASISHLLVDEFQDTSLSQRRLLEQLVSGWQGSVPLEGDGRGCQGDGRTLFLVGDPMQSIYRFRNAEVAIFLEARTRGLGGVALTPLSLNVNFRCQEGLVDWFNRVFGEVFPRHEDRVHGGVPYAASSAARPRRSEPAVRHHAFPLGGGCEEADRMVDLIRQARSDDPDQTVGVLVRGRSHLIELLPRLRAAEIDFTGVEIEALMGRTVVLDLLALTRALVHLGNRSAWLSILRAPWCALSLEDMHRLVHDELQETTVYQAMSDPLRRHALSPEGQQRIARVLPVLTSARTEQGRSSLRNWVEGTWVALGGPACCQQDSELEDAESYLGFLEGFDDGGDLESLEKLELSLKNLKARPDPASSGKLQIMTIHKAKGLEFDTVLLPGLARTTGKDDPKLFRWLERPTAEGSDLLLAPIRSADVEEDPTYKLLQRLDDKKTEHENLRLLYVAATRARRQLHLLFELKTDDADSFLEPMERSLLAHLWPQIQHDVVADRLEEAARLSEAIMSGEFEEEEAASAPAPAVQVVPPVPLVRLPSDWAAGGLVKTPEAVEEIVEAVSFDWVRENLRKVGTVVHQFLQMMGRQGIEAWSLERILQCGPRLSAALFHLGMGPDELGPATERALKALTQTVQDERGRWILSSQHSEIRCEYALRGKGLRNGVIDRTFVDAFGQRWLIDYKTSHHEGSGLEAFIEEEKRRYKPQLDRYAELLKVQFGQNVRTGLYFPLLQKWVEVTALPVVAVA